MVHVDLCWDEYGRNVLVCLDCDVAPEPWPVRLYPLGSATIEKAALTDGLVDQLDTFGTAELPAVDERVVVQRLKAA